jgi:hypothetical protein
MKDNNFDPFEEDDEEDLIDKYIKIWSSTDLEKYFMITRDDLSEEERTEIDLYFIEKYYPGNSNLTDDELLREKYYESKHCFQYVVSIKRLIEASGKGCVFADQAGWHYGFGGNA